MRRLVLLIVFLGWGVGGQVFADTNDGVEPRAHELARQIRCLVCQGQSIDESDAPLAKDLNLLLREKMQQGWTDQQILDHLTERYGDYILLKPRFASHTLLLWVGPFVIFIAGGGLIFSYWRRTKP